MKRRNLSICTVLLFVLFAGCTLRSPVTVPTPAPTPEPSPVQTAAPTPVPTSEPTPVSAPESTPEPTYEPKSWTICFAGDCTIGTSHEWRNLASDISFLHAVGGDYAYPFRNVREYFENDDLTVVNLEGTFTDSEAPVNKEHRFSAPPEYVRVLTDGGVDAVSLANNHSGDYSTAGTADTKAALEGAGVLWGDCETPVIAELSGGLKLGIVPFNAVEADLAPGDLAGYEARFTPLYQQCRDAGCQIVAAFVHWGWEYRYVPEAWMTDFGHWLAETGCDMVIAGHAHVLQPMELYQDVPIFYSLGNFCFGGHSNPADKDCVIVCQQIISPAENVYALGKTELIPCSISSVDSRNDFCPTPYAPDSAGYLRVLEKLGIYSEQ